MPRIPGPILKLLDSDLVPPAETPGQHLANAIQLLILADERLCQIGLLGVDDLTKLIRGAEARCFRALFELGREDS
jgi:hypothetical protein